MANQDISTYHICLYPGGSPVQFVEVQADSIEGEEQFGPSSGPPGYLKLKVEGNTVGQFPKAYIAGWWKTEGNEH